MEKIKNCLLGGAVGDALGAAVEFKSIEEIRRRFGKDGITDYAKAYSKIGAITDDTQMSLFTAEALINFKKDKSKSLAEHGHQSYLRWLRTQGEPIDEDLVEGYLMGQMALYSRRAPGLTCMGALRSGVCGTKEKPLNSSKGCGGIMRIAPVGLVDISDPFEAGMKLAAITHGHSSGYISAGFFALLIHHIFLGDDLSLAIQKSLGRTLKKPGCDEVVQAVKKAIELDRSHPSPEQLAKLGEGWVGEEALSISLYCALCAESFKHGILLAVNHSGDTDSTGSITGNILGLTMGNIPEEWLNRLELYDVICKVAEML